MKRNHFLMLAGGLACVFGLMMLLAPGQMIANMTTDTSEGSRHVLRWMGCPLFSIGLINIMARHDAGGEALRALMIGNIMLHVLGMVVDIGDYMGGFVLMSGLMLGVVVHTLLVIGFVYFLRGARAPIDAMSAA